MDFVSYRFELVIVLRFFVPCWNIYKLQTDIEYTRVRGSIAHYITFASSIYVRRLQSNDKHFETVAKVNSLTILLARLSRLCRKDEAQGAEGEVWREHTSVCDRSRIPKATQRFAFMQQSHFDQKYPTNQSQPRLRRTLSDTQWVTHLASSKIGAKRRETRFCRETWVRSGLTHYNNEFIQAPLVAHV